MHHHSETHASAEPPLDVLLYRGVLIVQPPPPPPPGTGIPYFPYSPEQWPVQWVLRTIAQKWAILGTHLSLFPAHPYALDQTMPCNVCHSKNAETVAFLSLAESDRCTLRQKHSDCAEDWVICELCVRHARPNPFFGSTSSRSATSTSTTTAATNATDTATKAPEKAPEAPEKAPEKYPALLLLFVIVFNACHVHL